jgi:hypothetical protein
MGNYQVWRLNLPVAVEENVEINGAWPAGLIPDAAGFAFNKKTAFQ